MIATLAFMRGTGQRVFYFNPEANVGSGATPDDVESMEQEVRRTPLPEDVPAPTTQTSTETTPPNTTH